MYVIVHVFESVRACTCMCVWCDLYVLLSTIKWTIYNSEGVCCLITW